MVPGRRQSKGNGKFNVQGECLGTIYLPFYDLAMPKDDSQLIILLYEGEYTFL